MGSPTNNNPAPVEGEIVEDQEVSTSQEALPVPMLAGTRKIAVKWICPILNLNAVEVPPERTGKK